VHYRKIGGNVASNLTSRLLAMALMMALLVKPCLGLISDWTDGRVQASGSSTAAIVNAGETPPPCKRRCISGWVEEVRAMARPVKAALAGNPVAIPARSQVVQFEAAPAMAVRHAASENVRTRLAMLSRLLL
jgi:hypothetical protein